jgi:hypothetical protein
MGRKHIIKMTSSLFEASPSFSSFLASSKRRTHQIRTLLTHSSHIFHQQTSFISLAPLGFEELQEKVL